MILRLFFFVFFRDGNVLQMLTPVRTVAGTVDPSNGALGIHTGASGKAIGFSIYSRMTSFFGLGYTYVWNSLQQADLSAISFKFILPMVSFQLPPIATQLEHFAHKIIPVVSDVVRFCMNYYTHIQENEGKWRDIKKYVIASAKEFRKEMGELLIFWFGAAMGGLLVESILASIGGEFMSRSLMEALGGSSFKMYSVIDLNVRWGSTFGKMRIKPKIEASASFFNIVSIQSMCI